MKIYFKEFYFPYEMQERIGYDNAWYQTLQEVLIQIILIEKLITFYQIHERSLARIIYKT